MTDPTRPPTPGELEQMLTALAVRLRYPDWPPRLFGVLPGANGPTLTEIHPGRDPRPGLVALLRAHTIPAANPPEVPRNVLTLLTPDGTHSRHDSHASSRRNSA